LRSAVIQLYAGECAPSIQ